jgi:hypothetical protein
VAGVGGPFPSTSTSPERSSSSKTGDALDKATKTLDSLMSKISTFPLTDPSHDSIKDDLLFIRAKYKVAVNRMEARVTYDSASGVDVGGMADHKDMSF